MLALRRMSEAELQLKRYEAILYRCLIINSGRGTADMVFRLLGDGGGDVYAHFDVMRNHCEKIDHGHFIEEEEDGRKMVIVPNLKDKDGVELEALKLFIQAIYIGTLGNISYQTYSEVLFLAHLYLSKDVKDLCYGYEAQLTEDNCDDILQSWPKGERNVHQAALDYMLKNLESLVANGKTLSWCGASWTEVLEYYCHTQEKLPLPMDVLYACVLRWWEEGEEENMEEEFVKMMKLMDQSFLFDVVKPKKFLNAEVMIEIADHLYKRDKDKLKKLEPVAHCSRALVPIIASGSYHRHSEQGVDVVHPPEVGSNQRPFKRSLSDDDDSDSVAEFEPTPVVVQKKRSQRKRCPTPKGAEYAESVCSRASKKKKKREEQRCCLKGGERR